jgi:Methyltransferase domain
MRVSQHIPWWAKIGVKIALAKAPVSYELWRRIGIFRHGKMIEASYSQSIFESHMASLAAHVPIKPNTLLELGPGDSVSTAIWARARAIDATTLVDAGRFATTDVNAYQGALKLAGLENHQAARASTIDDMLRLLGATYLCNGLTGLQSIPSGSIDAIFSNAVLEHVRRSEFVVTVRELFRIQRPGGVSSHQIDLRDHLGGALNSLRISHQCWESPLFSQSGFYTNRLRCSEIRSIFTDAGWEILGCNERRWPNQVTPRSALHADFQHFADEDLLVSGVRLVVRRPITV